MAPVASVPESAAESVVGDDELDEVDDNFTMPTAAAAAAAVSAAVTAAATAALLPAVLEEPVAESAVAAAAAVAVLVEASKGGEKKAVDVVADKVVKDEGCDKVVKDEGGDKVVKDDGGGTERKVGMRTLACCGAVAFGVGLAVAIVVRSRW
ncbi:unnamed protein product [Laminaria digitata]